ncbi:spore coat U domain-containing protein [Phyllobacterium sp. YR531]|uniref:Csu type fimbrial protein n=1 Tax=Phyllobacterium sp. YR531 TaxID=1144343 RepID=UPI0012F6809A|nr:spore coat U domain-containing protein [Phyllobacterium sp. YR531]
MQTTDRNQIGSDDYSFHQLQQNSSAADPSLLAWEITDANDKPYGTGKTSVATGGITVGLDSGAFNELNVDMALYLAYLPHYRQKSVRSGRYNTTYRLAAHYEFDSTNHFCDNPSTTIGKVKPVVSKFTLTADVLKGCQLENTDVLLDFGKVGAVSATRGARANANIDVRCTYETDYQLTLDNGRNFKDGFRRMKSGKNFIPYQLYSGSGTSVPWTKVSGKGAPVNSFNSHPIEGKLAPATVAPATGIYNDTVIMTLTF